MLWSNRCEKERILIIMEWTGVLCCTILRKDFLFSFLFTWCIPIPVRTVLFIKGNAHNAPIAYTHLSAGSRVQHASCGPRTCPLSFLISFPHPNRAISPSTSQSPSPSSAAPRN